MKEHHADSIVVAALTVGPENIGDTTILVACDGTGGEERSAVK